jgi:hypothetical protein
MKKQIQNLIADYKLRIRNLGYDQLTDDAMSKEAYESTVNTLNQVVADLERIEHSEDIR